MNKLSLPVVILFLVFTGPFPAAQAAVTVTADSTVKYLLACQKPNGAFGPLDQDYSDLAWNYPHKLTRLGGHMSDHVSNWIVPVGMSKPDQALFKKADETANSLSC